MFEECLQNETNAPGRGSKGRGLCEIICSEWWIYHTGIQILIDVVACDDEEGRGGGAAVLDAGSVQRVPLELEHVDLAPYACKVSHNMR